MYYVGTTIAGVATFAIDFAYKPKISMYTYNNLCYYRAAENFLDKSNNTNIIDGLEVTVI